VKRFPANIALAVALLAGAACAAVAAEPAEEGVLLVGPGVRPAIVLQAEAPPLLQKAAADLERCLETMTGAQIETVAEPPADGPVISVGDTPLARRHVGEEELAELPPEGLRIRTFPGGVVLVGRTEMGSTHAVYGLLDRLGCRWFFPGADWEEIPRRAELRLEKIDLQDAPSFRGRSIWYGWGVACKENRIDYNDWVRRNRMGGQINRAPGHAYHNIADPEEDFDEHPEWFPLIDGERVAGGQLCLSNPEVQQRAVEYVRSRMRRYPNAALVSLSPNDGRGYCECAACAAMGSTSDQTLKFANSVARAVEDEFPDRYIGMYAYAGNCAPPHVKAHPNIIIYVATAFIRGGYSLDQLLEGWSHQVSMIGVRDYFDVIIWSRDMPTWNVDYMKKRIPYYHERHVTAVSAEASNNWAARGLGYWVAGRLFWNAWADADAAVEEFYARCYHDAGPGMRTYYEMWRESRDVSPPRLLEAHGRLAEAVRLAGDDPVARRRVDMIRLYMHWVCLYRKHLTMRAARDRVNSAQKALHLSWRMKKTNMLHTQGHWREWRMWRVPGKPPDEVIARWRRTDEPFEFPNPEGELATPKDTGDEAAEPEGLDMPTDEGPALPELAEPEPPPDPEPSYDFTHEEIEAMCREDIEWLHSVIDEAKE